MPVREIPAGPCVTCRERPRVRGATVCAECKSAYKKGLGKRATKIMRQDEVLEAAGAVAQATAVATFQDLEEKRQRDLRRLRKLGDSETIARLDDLKLRLLESLQDEDLSAWPLKDRMIALGISIEKGLLLAGRPTQVLGYEERLKVSQLVPQLLREAQRRGLVIEAAPVDVTPGGG